MGLFLDLKFFVSAHNWQDLPADNNREIAFAGRSNSGKSSALNTLEQHKRLAFVSKQPGRTQLINFFQSASSPSQYLVDLPGYGYAKVPHHLRQHWKALLSRYLLERQSLVGLILIMDCRHPLTELDQQMLDWFSPQKKPIHVLLTKADKLSRNSAQKTLLETTKNIEMRWQNCSVQLFSSLKKQGIEEAKQKIEAWLCRL